MSSIERDTAARLAERAGFTPSPDWLSAIDEHVAGVEQARNNRDLRPEVVGRLVEERSSQTAVRLRALEATDLERELKEIEKEKRDLLQSVRPQPLTFSLADTSSERETKIATRMISAVEQANRRAAASEAAQAIRESDDPEEIATLAEDVALGGDALHTITVRRAAVARLRELYEAVPKDHRPTTPIFGALVMAQDALKQAKAASPSPSRRMKALEDRARLAELHVRTFGKNVAQLLRIGAAVTQEDRRQVATAARARLEHMSGATR